MQVEQGAKLLAFDRQNHMGANDRMTSNLEVALQEEAQAALAEKHVATGAVNISENLERMKVWLCK